MDSIIFFKKKVGDLTLSHIPPTNTTSSSSTTSTTSTFSIPSTNRRSPGLHPHIYSRLWLFQIRTAASGTEAESICLFRTSLSFRVQRNIVPLVKKMLCQYIFFFWNFLEMDSSLENNNNKQLFLIWSEIELKDVGNWVRGLSLWSNFFVFICYIFFWAIFEVEFRVALIYEFSLNNIYFFFYIFNIYSSTVQNTLP